MWGLHFRPPGVLLSFLRYTSFADFYRDLFVLYVVNCHGLRQVSSLSNAGYPFFALMLAHNYQSSDFMGYVSDFQYSWTVRPVYRLLVVTKCQLQKVFQAMRD